MVQMTLEERKTVLVDMLDYIDTTLNKMGIPYYLAYGTLLGAIRHKGFIPWDDDIDIWIPFDEYKRAISALKSSSDVYYVINFIEEKNCPWPFSKINDARTIMMDAEGNDKIKGYPLRGVNIDLFPLVDINDSKQDRIIKCWNRRQRAFDYLLSHAYTGLRKIALFFLEVIGRGEKYWRNKTLKEMAVCVREEIECGYPLSPYGKADRYKKVLFATHKCEFQGKVYNVPSGYKDILKQLYGDYMQLPPLEEQKKTAHNVIAYWKQRNDWR